MATQGVVGIIGPDGRMAVKVVAGCDGFNVPKLVERVEALTETPTVDESLALAREVGLGCPLCLMAGDRDHIVGLDEDEYPDVAARFRETFDQPRFNPRWEQGTADYALAAVVGTRKAG